MKQTTNHRSAFTFIFFAILLLFTSGCNEMVPSKKSTIPINTVAPSTATPTPQVIINTVNNDVITDTNLDSTLVFAGINLIDDITDRTVTLHWATHASAKAYEIYSHLTGGSLYFVGTMSSPTATSVTITSLEPNTVYYFRVRIRTIAGTTDTNEVELSATTLAAPLTPIVSLSSPAVSPDSERMPTLLISNVKDGDKVELFSDSTCNTKISEGTVSSYFSTIGLSPTSDLTVDISSSTAYTFSARAISPAPNFNNSACSTVNASYTLLGCPTGYIPVPHSTTSGTYDDFCVMKYEAKAMSSTTSLIDPYGCPTSTCSSDYNGWGLGGAWIPTSTYSGLPWRGNSYTDAKDICEDQGTKYGLITNDEWITIANNIESSTTNDAAFQFPGENTLINRGHSDNVPTELLEASADDTDGYYLTQTASPFIASTWTDKRTHDLSNGQVIWDLAGNSQEWVDWVVNNSDKAYHSGTGLTTYIDYTLIDTNYFSTSFMNSTNTGGLNLTSTASAGYGRFYPGATANYGVARRGGNYTSGYLNVGIYGLSTNVGYYSYDIYSAFRCVYHP